MPETFACPSCGAALEAPESAETAITCGYCGNTVLVPEAYRARRAVAPYTVVNIDAGDVVEAGAAAGRGLLVAIAAVVVLIGAGGVAAFQFLGSTDVPAAIEALASPTPDASPTPGYATRLLEFGGKGSGPGLFEDARLLAVDPQGNIFVGEYLSGKVQKLDPSGKFLQLITLPGEDDRPTYGMVADYAGSLWVSRDGNIYHYAAGDGELSGTIEGDFPDVHYRDLAVDLSNTLYAFGAFSEDDLVKLSADGLELARYDGLVSAIDDDVNPSRLALAVDPNGGIYVASPDRAQVFMFSTDGRFVDRFGEEGDAPGQLQNVQAIAADGQGRLFVADSSGVQVFGARGNFLGRIPREQGTGVVRAIALDREGFVYLLTLDGVVSKYRINAPAK